MKKQTNCRMCGSENMFKYLDLGFHPHSDQFRVSNEEPEMQYPLTLWACRECGLSQLGQVVDGHELYQKDYLYEASITKTADKHWSDLADDVIKTTGITAGRSVDIGGNDGTLALKFKERGFDAVNIDPCKEVCDISLARGVETYNEFWDAGTKLLPKADIITGTNVFAHVDDLDGFMGAVEHNLKREGVFVFESPYFGEFYKNLEWDTIYHQHLSYLSLKPLVKFLEHHDMEVFDVRFSPLHGGAFRCYIARKGQRTVQPIVSETIDKENWTEQDLIIWGKQCVHHKKKLFDLIYSLTAHGMSVAAVSSPAKGMTLMNWTGIGRYITFITEKSKLKIGRYTPGTHIKIGTDSLLVERQPDYAIILAWNFADEIIKNNPDYKGKWIIPNMNIEIR
jgi:C-methyltransferase./Methyltransferase domain./Hypothetical methyltransferase.